MPPDSRSFGKDMEDEVKRYRAVIEQSLAEFQVVEELMKVLIGAKYEAKNRKRPSRKHKTRTSVEGWSLSKLAPELQRVLGRGNGHFGNTQWLVRVRNHCAHRAYLFPAMVSATSETVREEREKIAIAYLDTRELVRDLMGLIRQEAGRLGMSEEQLRDLNAPASPWSL